ncbi:matrixin family metalloprotease [Pedococcus sp. KACC 23699]|uniref:Matrixin family metalloprotease n=1 Tax=Pedococcus sp. KACC 23699 TaxID=3149228 RepID=A0AAU7JYA7_9MICO
MFAQMRRGFGAGATQGNMILHELGHVIGLNHVSSPLQVMYPVIGPRTPNGYATGDRAGLVKLGKAAGCINVPPYVMSDLK